MKNNKEYIDLIDTKLSEIFNVLDYDDYVAFINESKELKAYDSSLGWNDNEYIVTDKMIDNLPVDYLEKVLLIVDTKLKEVVNEDKSR